LSSWKPSWKPAPSPPAAARTSPGSGGPLGKFGSTLTHAASGHILLCALAEEKMLPGTVVKEMLAEKVEAIEFEQGRALKKKEKEALKEEIMHTLLPRAAPARPSPG
jgi:DNA recombination-dependent growth factor C